MKHLLLSFILYSFVSCSPSKEELRTYFGGKIINPKSNVVLLCNQFGVLDSIPLHEDATFSATYDSLPKGLYYFKHGPEHQYVYLEPNDSVLVRLNTWVFDESLVFSGAHAEKNNLLKTTFLQSEKEDRDFYKYQTLSPTAFTEKIAILVQQKETEITAYTERNPTVDAQFLQVLKIAKMYPIYSKVERYGMRFQKQHDSILPASFYKHRQNSSLQLDAVLFYNPYNHYIINRFYNETFQKGVQKGTPAFSLALLETIFNSTASENIKNTYLKQVLLNHFYTQVTSVKSAVVFQAFLKYSSNPADKSTIQKLLHDVTMLEGNKYLPEFSVTNYNGSTISSKALLQGENTVLFFRNNTQSSKNWISSRIQHLQKKFPKLRFLVIEMNENTEESLPEIDIKKLFYLPATSSAHAFLTSKMQRTVLLQSNGKVFHGFAAISSKKIEEQLHMLQKK